MINIMVMLIVSMRNAIVTVAHRRLCCAATAVVDGRQPTDCGLYATVVNFVARYETFQFIYFARTLDVSA